ncbi:hypothetical protein [Reticulibacter mediterranei]|uniref:hypothetical protein n=1 Tax=Reticulibacter mediterranei TaxID=2778369 RepID=UPI001C6890BC|nr:hypothetical protein [Reticulibacter mediterranei]
MQTNDESVSDCDDHEEQDRAAQPGERNQLPPLPDRAINCLSSSFPTTVWQGRKT